MVREFRPSIDAFAFDNSWTLSSDENDHLTSDMLSAASVAVAAVAEPFAAAYGLIGIAVDVIASAILTPIVSRLLIGAGINPGFGLCGGMAYAALDYWNKNWVVPCGPGPERPDPTTPPGAELRDYIWKRLIDSLATDAHRMLETMLIEKTLPGGDSLMLDQTNDEWGIIRRHLDAGQPWPFALIGPSFLPFDNHQMLAIGYDDLGNSRMRIKVYDSNNPGKVCNLEIDLSSTNLGRSYDANAGSWWPLKAMLAHAYSPRTPPIAVGLEEIRVKPGGPYHVGDTVSFEWSGRNAGFGKQFIYRAAMAGGPTLMPDGYKQADRVVPGVTRQGDPVGLVDRVEIRLDTGKAAPGHERDWAGPPGIWRYVPIVEVAGGGDLADRVWKSVPAIGAVADHVDLDVDPLLWTQPVAVSLPSGWGNETAGLDLALVRRPGSFDTDVALLWIDNPAGANVGWVRTGTKLVVANGVADVMSWAAPVQLPVGLGDEDQGAGIAVGSLSFPDIVDAIAVRIDNPGGSNHAYYAMGRRLEPDGNALWNSWTQIPGDWGDETAGAGATLVVLPGRNRPSLFVFFIDNPAGENAGYYRVGYNVDEDGHVTGGWSDRIVVPAWWGFESAGAGVAAGDMTGSGDVDLIIFNVDNPSGGNRGLLRVGWKLDGDGRPRRGWTLAPEVVPGRYGDETAEVGVAFADLSGNGRPDLVFVVMDNPGGGNQLYLWAAVS